jgi:hypothetical protein
MTTPENAAQIAVTRGFVDMDPTCIELFPQVAVITPSGGRSYTRGESRGIQRFKLIPMTFDQRPTTTAGGVERIIDYHLLGTPDVVVEVNDVFSFDGFLTEYYLVVADTDGHRYERKVMCERHLMRDGLQQVT